LTETVAIAAQLRMESYAGATQSAGNSQLQATILVMQHPLVVPTSTDV
jgi:hypothetical protein